MQKTKASRKIDESSSRQEVKNPVPTTNKKDVINKNVAVAPPVDEMKPFIENLPIICNMKQKGYYILPEKEKDALEHSRRTLRDLMNQIQELKLSKLNDDCFLKKPTVLQGVMKNDKRISIKLVYKHAEILKNFDKKIKMYLESKEKATSEEEKNSFHMKIIKCEGSKRVIEEILKNEKNIVSIRHKNCLKVFWFGDFINHYVYLSENICTNRDLAKFSEKFRKFLPVNKNILSLNWLNFISENLIRYLATQIFSAIEFFRNFKIVHGNLTLDNILLTGNFQIKITDFACSKYYRSNEIFRVSNNQLENSRDCLAPEFFRNDKFVEFRDAHKIDIFSMGSSLFKLATGKSLFEDNNKLDSTQDKKCIDNIVKQVKKIPEVIEEITGKKWSSDFIKILQRMMEPFEKGRINIYELNNSNWVRNNQKNLSKIEAIYHSDSLKMLTEMMKADHVTYYNNTSREKEDEYMKKNTKLELINKVEFTHINMKKNREMGNKNMNIKSKRTNLKMMKIRIT